MLRGIYIDIHSHNKNHITLELEYVCGHEYLVSWIVRGLALFEDPTGIDTLRCSVALGASFGSSDLGLDRSSGEGARNGVCKPVDSVTTGTSMLSSSERGCMERQAVSDVDIGSVRHY